jgi:hypothetical protein
MKYKYFKKSLSVLLAVAVFCGVLTSGWLTTEVEANAWSISRIISADVPRRIGNMDGVWTSGEQILMHAGAGFTFDLRLATVPTQGRITLRVINAAGAVIPHGEIHNSGNRLTGQMGLTLDGRYRFRLINTSDVPVFVTGVAMVGLTVRNHNTEVVFDRSYGGNSSIPGLETMHANATNTFRTTFAIDFRLMNNGIWQSANLDGGRPGGTCPWENHMTCYTDCGRDENCHRNITDNPDTSGHHKGAGRLIGRLPPSNAIFSIGVVGHRMCHYHHDDNNILGHRNVLGIGAYPGTANARRSVSTTGTGGGTLARVVQHELGHNLGAGHCRNNQACIMKSNKHPDYATFSVMNTWCDSCRNAIWNTKFSQI